MNATQRRLVAVALVALLGACASSEESATTSTTTTPTTTTEKATTTTVAARSSRCLDVPPALVDGIATGLKGGTSLRAAQAVKSKDYVKAWMIAAEIEGPSMDGDDHIAVWASNSLDAGKGLIMSVDGFAKEFSDWPDASKTKADIRQGADGVKQARGCVKAAL